MSAKEEADKLRSEAKKLFLDLFSLRKPDIERIVDCIIGAAVLEVAAIQQSAQQKMHPTLGDFAASDSESAPAPKRVI